MLGLSHSFGAFLDLLRISYIYSTTQHILVHSWTSSCIAAVCVLPSRQCISTQMCNAECSTLFELLLQKGYLRLLPSNRYTDNGACLLLDSKFKPVSLLIQANSIRRRPLPLSEPSSRSVRILCCVRSSLSTAFESASKASSIGQGSRVVYFAKDRIGSRCNMRPLRLWKEAASADVVTNAGSKDPTALLSATSQSLRGQDDSSP